MSQPLTAAVRYLSGEREPVRVATTANITLQGLFVVDDVELEVGDRVLVKNQDDPVHNGIYLASAGVWFRAPDASWTRAINKGTTVNVQEGTAFASRTFVFQSQDPVVGKDPIAIAAYFGTSAPLDVGTTAGTVAAGDDERIVGAAQAGDLGTAATKDVDFFATAAQGALADSALQPGDLGDSAALDVGTTAGTVAAGDDPRFAQIGSDGSYSPEIMVGMTLANAPADLDHDITISPGQRRNTANTTNMDLVSAITKRIDAAWAAGNNAGGLDTGTVAANKTYFLHVIKNTTTNVVDVLFSLSPTAPAMPSGYTARRRLGAVLTDASANIHPFLQTGGWFYHLNAFESAQIDFNPNVSFSVTLDKMPLGIKVIADISFLTAGGSAAVLSVCDQDLGDATINDCVGVYGAAATIFNIKILTDAARRINLRSSGGGNVYVYSRGWFDERRG